MKKRSEVIAMKKRSEVSKPAEEPKEKVVHCTACKTVSPADKATKRADGKLECPECGAAIDPAAATSEQPEPIPPPKQRPPIGTEPLPQMYCSTCGTPWPRDAEGGIVPSGCDHRDGMVDDPSKAEHWEPPAGSKSEEAKPAWSAVGESVPFDPKRSPPAEGRLPPTYEAPVRITGNRIEADWGKMVFKLDDYGVNMTVGPFVGSREIPEGADLVLEGAKLLKDLKAMADTAFAEQITWYIQKLGVIAKKLNG